MQYLHVTLQLLGSAAAELGDGEMLSSSKFTLKMGMSCVGLLNPKLDMGMHRVPERSIGDRVADGACVVWLCMRGGEQRSCHRIHSALCMAHLNQLSRAHA